VGGLGGANVTTPDDEQVPADEPADDEHEPEDIETMASFNKVILMGNLTRDPALKHLPSQTAVVEFGIACNRRFKTQAGEDKEEVTFVDCTAFGRTGEVISQYMTKGKPIFIEGRLKYDTWDDKGGGGRRHKLTVVVESFQFVGGRDGGEGGEQQQATQRAARQPVRRAAPKPVAAGAPEEPSAFEDDDVPF
jgi:single-strand DNA-binding protein